MKTKILVSLLLCSSVFVAPPASAYPAPAYGQPNGWYYGLNIGVSANNEADLSFDNGVNGKGGVDAGLAFSGAVGYHVYPWLRVEGELGYFSGEFEGTNSSDMSAMTYMVNVFADWKNETAFTPYIGGGIGAATVSVDVNESFTSGGTTYTWVADDDSTVFAWQIGAGVSYEVQKRLSADFGWRYISTSDAGLNTTLNAAAMNGDADFSSNLIRLGLRYNF